MPQIDLSSNNLLVQDLSDDGCRLLLADPSMCFLISDLDQPDQWVYSSGAVGPGCTSNRCVYCNAVTMVLILSGLHVLPAVPAALTSFPPGCGVRWPPGTSASTAPPTTTA